MNKKRVLIVLAVLLLLFLVWANTASGFGQSPIQRGYIWFFGLKFQFKKPEELVVKGGISVANTKPVAVTSGPRVK